MNVVGSNREGKTTMNLSFVSEILKMTALVGIALLGSLAIHTLIRNRAKKISCMRLFVQSFAQVAIFFILAYPVWLSLVLVVLLLLTVILGRFFCGWLCPFGFYMDLITLLRKAIKKRYINLPERVNLNLHRLRYVILLVLLILPILYVGPAVTQLWPLAVRLLGPFNPPRILLAPMVPVVTPWTALYGLNLNFPYVDQIIHYSSPDSVLASVLFFVAFAIVSSMIVRRFWCRFCPTGASVGIVNRIRGLRGIPLLHLHKEESKCTKCGICKRVCPVQVTETYERKSGRIKTSMCMLCLRCVEMCPSEGALEVKIASKTVFGSSN